MRQFLQINLFLSSLLIIALVSCSPIAGHKLVKTSVVTKNEVQTIIDKNKSLLYKANIDLYNKHFSGLILLKQISTEIAHLTFVTEIGMKMFDFEIRDTSFKLVYVFEPLNKPNIIALLESDMKLILLHQLFTKQSDLFEKKEARVYRVKDNFRYYYSLNKGTNTVSTLKKKGSVCTKVNVRYLYNDSLQMRDVRLKHKGLIRLKIELTTINKRL